MPLPSLLALLLAGGRIPSTPILDSFNRADETPLSDGGNWAVAQLDPSEIGMKLVSNVIKNQTGFQGADYRITSFTANQEAFFTLIGKWSTDGAGFFLLINLQSPTAVATICGYLFTSYGSSGDVAELYRIDNGVLTLLGATVTGIAITVGDRFVARNRAGVLTFYQNKGSGWKPLLVRNDTTYGAGFIGLGCDDNVAISLGVFGGGSVR